MPVKVAKIGDKWRIVEKDGSISETSNGNPKDGGGHDTYEDALKQMRAIDMHIEDKKSQPFFWCAA